VIWLRRNSLSSKSSEKWAEVETQLKGAEGMSDSC
jgi:hypothetical protein